MSYHNELNELEKRLRQSKPQAERLPPALKRQMRQELMEQMTMNESRFSFRKVSMALGGLILLIGIPVFFWLVQMSIGPANVPGSSGSEPAGNKLDPSRPTPTVAVEIDEEDAVEVPFVEVPEDQVWLISADIPQGSTIGRYDVVNVTVGYKLVNLQEAEILLKLVYGPRGVLTVNHLISGAEGTAVIPLPLSELEEVSGSSIDLELNLVLRAPGQVGGKLPYIDFVEGWTVDLTAEPPVTTAEIIRISKPVPVEEDGLTVGTTYKIELTTAYSLAGYEEALLIVGYEYSHENGSVGSYNVAVISAGSGEVPVALRLDSNLFNQIGETIEGVNFFVRINRYDELLDQWVNLYPGNVALGDGERNLPYPYFQDSIFIQSTAWNQDETGQPILNVSLGYNLTSQESAEARIFVIGEDKVSLASETVVIEKGDGSITVPIAFAPSQLGDNAQSWISAELTTDAGVLKDEQLWWVSADLVDNAEGQESEGAANEQVGLNDGEMWIIATDVVTRTTENGVAADITLIVGYELSEEYIGGRIDFASEFQTSENGGGSSGGGGSSSPILSGSGTTEFAFGFETTSWLVARDWLESISTYLRLFGYSADGDEVSIGEFFKIGTD